MEGGGIKVVHTIPGRVRVKMARLKENPAIAPELQECLSAVQGMQRVEVNPLTGSVLILYDRTAFESLESLLSLAAHLSPLFPNLDLSGLDDWLTSENTNGNAPPVAERLGSFFGGLNVKVSETTGGVDLKFLLPLALFLLGVRAVMVAGKGMFPTWYDLLWFAFGSFFMLNPGVVEGRR